MAGKNTAVFGIYTTRRSVENAVDSLKIDGFRNTDISVLLPENEGTKDFAHEKQTKAPEGAAAGAGTGAILGGTLGWLTGIGALAIPGLGPFVAAGPIMAALAGVGVGGALGGVRRTGRGGRGLADLGDEVLDLLGGVQHVLREAAHLGQIGRPFRRRDRVISRRIDDDLEPRWETRIGRVEHVERDPPSRVLRTAVLDRGGRSIDCCHLVTAIGKVRRAFERY